MSVRSQIQREVAKQGKKPGEVARERELASAREAEATDTERHSLLGAGGIGMKVARGIQRLSEVTDPFRSGVVASNEELKTNAAKRALKRQQNLREKGNANP